MTASIECSSHISSTQSWCNVHTLDCNVYAHSWLSHSPGESGGAGNSCTVTVLLIKVSISSSSVTEGNKTCQRQENKMLPGRRGVGASPKEQGARNWCEKRSKRRKRTHSGAAVDEGPRDLQHVRVFGELEEVPLKLLFVLRHLAQLHLQPLKLLLNMTRNTPKINKK